MCTVLNVNDSLWEPVTVSAILANAAMSMVAAVIRAYRNKATGAFLVLFTVGVTCSNNRGAGLGVISFAYNGNYLSFDTPYRFYGRLNNEEYCREIIRVTNDLVFLANPVSWTAGTEFRCSGVALMKL